MRTDATGFIVISEDPKTWCSENGRRVIVKRAENRYQAYEYLGDELLSVGYPITRDGVRLFLKGHAVEMIAQFGEDTTKEPLTFQHPSLTTF